MRNLSFAWGLAASACVAAAPNPVPGITSVEIDNAGRRFTSELWYEAAPGAPSEDFTIRLPLRSIAMARNSIASQGHGKRPLIVLSHGNWGSRFSQGWLATRLVDAGYVVLSTSHPGTLGDDQTVVGRARLWDRSRDVSAALTQLLRQPRWSALIDPDRIGFAGHSFGGWTGISLAGGRYDPVRQRAACETAAKRDFYCDGTLKDDVSGVKTSDAADATADSRIKAFYIMASGPGQGFSEESLQSIRAPFVFETARFDEILDPQAHSSALAKRIPTAREIVRPVGHFAYVPLCKPVVGALIARAAGVPICNDADGVDRATVHQQVAADVVTFFDKQFAVKR
jgi:predicted dienelactone hydrolase